MKFRFLFIALFICHLCYGAFDATLYMPTATANTAIATMTSNIDAKADKATTVTLNVNGSNTTKSFAQNDTFGVTIDGSETKLTAGTNISKTGSGTVASPYVISVSATIPTILTATATIDFGNTLAGASTDQTVTVTGAALNDPVVIGSPNGSVAGNGAYFGWVSSANTVSVRFLNNNLLAAINPASGSFTIKVIQ